MSLVCTKRPDAPNEEQKQIVIACSVAMTSGWDGAFWFGCKAKAQALMDAALEKGLAPPKTKSATDPEYIEFLRELSALAVKMFPDEWQTRFAAHAHRISPSSVERRASEENLAADSPAYSRCESVYVWSLFSVIGSGMMLMIDGLFGVLLSKDKDWSGIAVCSVFLACSIIAMCVSSRSRNRILSRLDRQRGTAKGNPVFEARPSP